MSRVEYISSLPLEVRRLKSYVMVDILTATVNNECGYTIFRSCDNKVSLQSIYCLECGGYTITANPEVYLSIAHNALCCCDGFMDEYLDKVCRLLEWDRQELLEQQCELDEDTDEEDNYDVDDYNDF